MLSGYNFPTMVQESQNCHLSNLRSRWFSQYHRASRYLYWHITHIQANISFSLWGFSCKTISVELVLCVGRRAMALNWPNPAKEKLTAASSVKFVPLAARLALEWRADLLLLESTVRVRLTWNWQLSAWCHGDSIFRDDWEVGFYRVWSIVFLMNYRLLFLNTVYLEQ